MTTEASEQTNEQQAQEPTTTQSEEVTPNEETAPTPEDNKLTDDDLAFINDLIGEKPEKEDDSFFTGEKKDDAQEEEQTDNQEEDDRPLTHEEMEELIELAEENEKKVEKFEAELSQLRSDIEKKEQLIQESTEYWNKIMEDPKLERLVKAHLKGDDVMNQISESALASLESEIDSLPKEVTNDVSSEGPQEFNMNNWLHENKDSGLTFSPVS